MTSSPASRASATAAIPPPEPPRTPPRQAAEPVMLRHAKPGTIALRGPRSGRVYRFTHGEPTAVLAEDAPALLRSGAIVSAGEAR